ncbi:sigma54 specific transcriptional regulator, Fis family [Desulfonatronospira thiodismutans ASO3-1]|uniref:Sigma54 specific transcriptional regulator, Fis family n=1 Tax=Desulfonatronospira thiodismutans ASO3-1 TaxID=555779 RepID=D6SPJ5_9BACT|nr:MULTISPECIES: sigma-54 dependent transcriptional regulator [Desulfonatronospira]EFI34671.1 sigma54 specific transcriptional regulator, Fis family [Desulfonatronospira thiodismutans ASO3-1]RQD73158.1 MAG: sigma-54-dependent Fis family transcriptional regulator [Desulfonatronospira sp. MSAO_Bac3]
MSVDTSDIIGKSRVLRDVFNMLAKVAPTETTVLVAGESGTGKELLVRALHRNSQRRDKPMVPVNCGAIPKELLESELFGHEKGAFTHAVRSRAGRFEMAEGGTLFLDEIGELDMSLQVKILRFLQEKEFERVGGSKSIKADVRVIAATNRNLEEEVKSGCFREDLFYRLNVIPIELPPLRRRGDDVLLLAEHFLDKYSRGSKPLGISSGARDLLLNYPWPGNVRELENFMERMSILCDNNEIKPADLPEKVLQAGGIEPEFRPDQGDGFKWPSLKDMQESGLDLKDFLENIEDRLLLEALENSEWVKNQAAEVLGIKRTTLIEKLKKKDLAPGSSTQIDK